MFVKPHQTQKQQANHQIYRPGQRVPVFTADTLLSHQKYKNFINKIKDLSEVSPEVFDHIYLGFLHQFAEFVQVLPSQKEGAFCGLLNEGLMRGYHALMQWLYRDHEVTPLERYAIFTAGVLKDIAKIMIQQRIFIVDEQGNWLQEWQPLNGALTQESQVKFYKIIYQGLEAQRLRSMVTPLLARQLMPATGFSWLANDSKIFTEWLAILCGEPSQGGRVESAFQISQENVESFDLPIMNLLLEDSMATLHADAFLAWLQESLAKGDLKVTHDSGIQRTSDGIFLELSEKSGVFKQFSDLYLTPVDMFTLFQQIGNLLGLAKQSGSDYRYERLFSESGEAKGKFSLGLNRGEQNSKQGIILNSNIIDWKGNIANISSTSQTSGTNQGHHMPLVNANNKIYVTHSK